MYLVLLAPCTDWFVSFTLLGKGDARVAIAATPVRLLSQMFLLPAWLWLFLGGELAGVVRAGKFLEAFLGLIVLPLVLVAITEATARRSRLAEGPRAPSGRARASQPAAEPCRHALNARGARRSRRFIAHKTSASETFRELLPCGR